MEHIGRIPLARRKRRKPPSKWTLIYMLIVAVELILLFWNLRGVMEADMWVKPLSLMAALLASFYLYRDWPTMMMLIKRDRQD